MEVLKIEESNHEHETMKPDQMEPDVVQADEEGMLPSEVMMEGPEEPEREEVKEVNNDQEGFTQIKRHACTLCGQTFHKMSSLKRHHYTHTGERPFKCAYCPEGFVDKWKRNRHLILTHKTEGNHLKFNSLRMTGRPGLAQILPKKRFVCKVCGRSFATVGALGGHTKVHRNKNREMLKKAVVNRHVEPLSQEPPRSEEPPAPAPPLPSPPPSAPPVSKELGSSSTEKTEPPNPSPGHVCPHCGKKFNTVFALGAHSRWHMVKRPKSPKKPSLDDLPVPTTPVAAPFCDDLTSNQFKPMACTVCNKEFKYPLRLTNHMKMHTDVTGPIKCCYCPKEFADLDVVVNHILNHSRICPTCGEAFSWPSQLRSHMREQHSGGGGGEGEAKPVENHVGGGGGGGSGEHEALETMPPLVEDEESPLSQEGRSPSKRRECTLCGRQLCSLASLKRHMMVHTDERPYKCTVCGKGFNNRWNMKTHTAKHARAYHCVNCSRWFQEEHRLLQHDCPANSLEALVAAAAAAPADVTHDYDESTLDEEEFNSHRESRSRTERPVNDDSAPDGVGSTSQPRPSLPNEQVLNDLASPVIVKDSPKDRPDCQPLASESQMFQPDHHLQNTSVRYDGEAGMDGFTEDIESMHNTPSKPKRTFECHLCKRSFGTYNGLGGHMKYHKATGRTSGPLPPKKSFVPPKKALFSPTAVPRAKLECTVCSIVFVDEATLREHLLEHINLREGNRPKCPVCGKVCSNTWNGKIHLKNLHPEVYQQFCESTSSMGEASNTRLASYRCRICFKAFDNIRSMRIHIGRSHRSMLPAPPLTAAPVPPPLAAAPAPAPVPASAPEAAPLPAPLAAAAPLPEDPTLSCEEEYADEELKGRSPRAGRHLCTVCGKTLKTAIGLKIHSYIHTGEKPFACKFCGKRFRHSWLRTVHMRKCKGTHLSLAAKKPLEMPPPEPAPVREQPPLLNAFQCKYCFKQFTSGKSLGGHMRHHTSTSTSSVSPKLMQQATSSAAAGAGGRGRGAYPRSAAEPLVEISSGSGDSSSSWSDADSDGSLTSAYGDDSTTCDRELLDGRPSAKLRQVDAFTEEASTMLRQRKLWSEGVVQRRVVSKDGRILGCLVECPNGFGPFKCCMCSRRFTFPADFAKHLMYHADRSIDRTCLNNLLLPGRISPEKNCECDLFGLTFSNCDTCVEGFADLEEMKTHVHSHLLTFVESMSLAYRAELAQRGKSDAFDALPWFVDDSPVQAPSHRLTHQVHQTEDGEELHECPICGLRFKKYASLSTHMGHHKRKKNLTPVTLSAARFPLT